jgi:hypothetical protein
MGLPRLPGPELLIIAAFSRYAEALDWARRKLEAEFGPIALQSEPFPFTQTTYYETSMGTELQKLFYVFQELVPFEQLAAIKLRTNELEAELAAPRIYPETRPLNLDPGLLSLGKFVLATTKDQGHRIYVGDGIYAEVTLRFQHGSYEPWPWTYADYRQTEVHRFLHEAREFYRRRLQVSRRR